MKKPMKKGMSHVKEPPMREDGKGPRPKGKVDMKAKKKAK